MAETFLIVVYAVFAWWAATAAVLHVSHRPPSTFRNTLVASTGLMALGFLGLWQSASDATATGTVIAFTSALLVWAWQEVTFYTGVLTGPRKTVCPPDCRGFAHFGHAVLASLHHEISILVALLVIWALTAGGANQIGLWTFVVLLVMHESARLNVLLGVQNLSEEFVPEHLAFLRGFLNRKSMNLLFPVSVTASTVVAVLLVQHAAAAPAGFAATGLTLLATLLALGILEHWFLVVPLPSGKLWAWSIERRENAEPPANAGARGGSDRVACSCSVPHGLRGAIGASKAAAQRSRRLRLDRPLADEG